MIVQEFRFLSEQDPCNDEPNWSRRYEYEKVLRRVRSLRPEKIHNTSCGYKKTHTQFGEELAGGPWETVHSDITQKPGQLQWDITTSPPFQSDLVLCLSTLEHLNHSDRELAWKNLWDAISPEGTLIYTFDYPSVSIEWLEGKVGETCVSVVNKIANKWGATNIIYMELTKEIHE